MITNAGSLTLGSTTALEVTSNSGNTGAREDGHAAMPQAAGNGEMEDSGVDVVDLLRAIDSGQTRGKDLTPAERLRCVAYFTTEGFTTAEIARSLDISERSIRRDRATLRKDEALTPSRTLGDELLGEFQRLTLASIARLTRMANDPQNPAYARLWAEDAISRTYQRLVDTAHRLKYVEDGGSRLKHLREIDPQELQRTNQAHQAFLQKVRNMDVSRSRALP